MRYYELVTHPPSRTQAQRYIVQQPAATEDDEARFYYATSTVFFASPLTERCFMQACWTLPGYLEHLHRIQAAWHIAPFIDMR